MNTRSNVNKLKLLKDTSIKMQKKYYMENIAKKQYKINQQSTTFRFSALKRFCMRNKFIQYKIHENNYPMFYKLLTK